MRNALAPIPSFVLFLSAFAACAPAGGASKRAPLDELAHAALAAGCDNPIVAPPVPEAATPTPGTDDVVVYTAHPDDEAMYGGGTMAALVRAGRRVTVVVMSHGEGGRMLELGPDGGVVERRDIPVPDVIVARDKEIARATAAVGVRFAVLYPPVPAVDYGWTTSCSDALEHWDGALPGGVRAMLEKLIVDIRARRPRVILTLDPRDDPHGSRHGHHRAVGMLVELAARAAADPAIVAGGAPHVVDEVLSYAPKGMKPDVSLDVGSEARLAMLREYPSQFRDFDALARRPVEEFMLRWRARGAAVAPGDSVVAQLLHPRR